MAKKPLVYLELFPDDTLASIMRSGDNSQTFGAKVILWCVSASQKPVGTLPDDNAQLRRWTKLSKRRWASIKDRVTGGWQLVDGRWVIRRVVEAAEKRRKKCEQAADAARTRYASASDEQCVRIHSAVRPHCPPSPSPSPSPTPTKKSLPEGSRSRYTPEHLEVLGEKIQALQQRYPRWWPKLAGYCRYLMRETPPLDVVCKALDSTLAHGANDPCAYIAKILRVEVPNFHEAAAISRHHELEPAEEPRGSGNPVDLGTIIAQARMKGGE